MWVGGSVSCSLGAVPHIRPHPTRGGRRAGGPPALRLRFEVGVSHSLGSEPHIPHPPPNPIHGGRGVGGPPLSGRGLRLAFLILRGQYWGRCWGLSPTSPPSHPRGAQGWGSPRPQLWVPIPLYGAALPPHRLLETPFPPFASLLYREPTELYFQPRLFFQSRRRPTACGAAVGPRGRDGIVRRSRWGRCVSHKPAFISRPYGLPYRKPYSTAPAATA